jgi:predicted AAA+ superfamily ATPase
MKEKIAELLIEEWAQELKPLVPRSIKIDILPEKATILTGIRRCGKSTHLRALIRKKNKSYFYINFSDERLAGIKLSDLGLCLEVFFELKPEAKDKEICIGLDEIQMIDGWELFVDRLLRNKFYEVYVTGSSSKLLSKEIETQMRGRSLSYELFPFHFKEYIHPLSVTPDKMTVPQKGQLVHHLKKYLIEGGFPETRGLPNDLRYKILQEYYNTIIYKDVIERQNPKNPHAVAQCLKIFINQAGSLYSINKIVNKCKSLGLKISKSDVSEYLGWFEDCYLFFSVPVFTENINRQMTNPKKLYCIDNGFIRANQSGININSGHLLENLVFNSLRQKFNKIFYYKNNIEVDFLIYHNNKILLFQVCESLNHPEIRKREVESLLQAMIDLKIKTGWIVTMEEKSKIEVGSEIIKIIPLLDFLLWEIEGSY